MLNPRARNPEVLRKIFGLTLFLTAAISCNVYDPSLLDVSIKPQHDSGTPSDAGRDTGMMSSADASD